MTRSRHICRAFVRYLCAEDRTSQCRQFTTANTALLSPQYGGYLNTGQAGRPADAWKSEPRFLVTGASGQIGAELIPLLRDRFVCQPMWLSWSGMLGRSSVVMLMLDSY